MPFVPVAGPGFEEQKETGGFVPVSAKLFGEEHPIVGELPSPYRGVASKPVVSFRLPTEDDPEHRIFLSPSDDGGLPNVLKNVGGSFVVSGRFDDGRRDAADAGQLRPLYRPFVPAKPAAAEGSPDPLAILSQPSVMSLLKSRNPERWRNEVEPLLQQADEFGRHPFEKADAKTKAAKILNEMIPEGGLGTQYQSEKKQVASGRKVMQRPTIIDSNGRVQYFPELKPRENVGDEVPIDEGVLRGDHEAARLEYQRSKRPDSVLGRQAERLRAGVEGVSGALWRPFLPQDVSDELVRNQESQGQAFNEVSGPIERQVGGAIQSAGTMLAAAPVAAMAGTAAPLVFGGAAGLSTGNQALTQATDAGLSGEQRIGHALMQGGLEAGVSGVFSKVLGMPGMEGALSRALGQRITSQSAAKIGALVAGRLAKAGLEEVPEELVTSAAQNAASRLSGVDPNKGLLDPEEAADVIVQSFIGGAGANLPGSVLGARRENPTAYKNLTRDLPIGSNPTTKTGEKVRIVGYDDQNVVVQPVQTVGGKEQLVGEKRTVPQSELKPEFTPYEHSREFADKWAAENPEAAKALAAKAGEQPSIADFEKAGLNRRGVSAGQRKEFADWLAEGELLRNKPAASTDTGFMTPPVEQPKQLGPDVPKRVTDRMKNALANRGFDRAFIDTLSPVQAQAILANRKGTKLGQKAEVPPTDEAAIAPKTEARDALIKFVAEKNYSDPNRFEFRDADLEYQRLKAAYDAEIRSNAAREAAKSRRETSAEREQAQAAIEEGQIDRENAKFAPLNMMDEQLAQKIREEAKIQFENSDSEDTRAALQKIIDGNDVNAGGEVEAQKERIIKILSGELDQRTGWTRKTEAPRPADPIATGLLKSTEERQADIDEAVKALADGTPNSIVDEARRLAGEELNQDRDIELPYLEPGEQQILDKIDEIAGKLGVEPKGKPVIEGMEDDSFDFGANVEEKSVAEESNPPKTYRDVMKTAKEDFDAVYGDRDENGERKAEESKPKKLGEKAVNGVSEIMAKVRRDANQRDLEDHERSLSGVNFWGRGIDPELGDQFDAHGLSAQDLQSLLENGIDENRPFHTAKISDPADGLGLRDHQPFVVVGHPGKGLKEGGIRAVVVDPLHTPSIPDLQKAFPGVQFIPAENSAIELAKIAKEEGGLAKPKKLGPAAEQPAKSDTVAERYRRTSGNELGEVVAPKTQSQRDAVDFFKARGKTVKFFAPPNNSQAASFFDPKTGDVYLNANVSDAERFSYLIGHEYAHASGADSRLADLPKQLLDSAKAYYLERSNPNYRQKLLDDDALLTREAVAVFVGRVFSEPKYRSLIRNENPGVLEKIVEFVKSLFVGDDYAKLPEAVRRVVDELNSHVQPKGRKLGGGDSGNGNRYDTYAGFAEPNRGTAAGKLGAAVAEAMGENEKPKWSMEDVAEGAIAAEAKNPEKARAEIEKLLKGDAPLTKEQTALANVVKRRLASEYVKTGDAAALKEYIDFKQRYLAKRSQAGDILRVGQEDLFSKLETREGREQALADALLDMTPAEVERLDAAVKNLRKAGIDEEDLLFSEGFHGTPHVVDRFTTSKIGTGEGAQAYGWGLYFSSASEVARAYRDHLSRSYSIGEDRLARYFKPGRQVPAYGGTLQTVLEFRPSTDKAGWSVKVRHADGYVTVHSTEPDAATYTKVTGEPLGQLYKVNLKPEEDEYLDWDKPMAKQSAKVKAAFGLDEVLKKVAPLGNRLKQVESQIDSILDSDDYDTDKLYSLEDERDSIIEKIREITPIEKSLRGWYYPDIQMTGEEKYDELSKKFSSKYVSWIDEEGVVWAASDIFPNESDEDSSQMLETAILEMKDSLKGIPISYVSEGGADYARIGEHDIRIEYRASSGGARKASEYLLSKGIRGNTYIGDYKKSDGKGARNYVVFDENDIDAPEVMLSEEGVSPRDANFKKWFGDSKVVDENGKPLRLYHATPGDFKDFKQRYFAKRSQAGDILRVGQEDLFSKLETREGREQALADALLDMTPAEVERLDAAVKNLRKAGIDEEDLLFSEGFHGTPHVVDRFTTAKIGTGEGNQKYGWGLYFSSKDEVARSYRNALSKPTRTLQQKAMDEYDEGYDLEEAAALLMERPDLTPVERRLLEALQKDGWLGFDYPHQAIKAAMRDVDAFDPSPELREAVAEAKKPQGNLYKVNLKPEEDEYLDWNKTLSQQSAKVRRILGVDMRNLKNRKYVDMLHSLDEKVKANPNDENAAEEQKRMVGALHRINAIEWNSKARQWQLADDIRTGGDLYDELRRKMGAKRASEHLLSQGIRGTTYIGDYAKSGGEGARNYVVFDENDVDAPEVMLSDEDYLGNALNQKSSSERKKLGEAKKKADAARPLLEGRQAEDDYRRVLASIEARQAAFRKQMIDKGVIPKSQAEYERFIKDPLKVQQAIIEINAHKSSAADRLLEYWYNAVLSAPTTHVKNVTGNVINGGRMAAVGFTKIIGEVATLQKKPEHAVSELAAFWSGFWGGLMPAARNFTTAWNTELSALARKVGRDKRSSPLEWAEGVASIPGTLGRVIRYPKRFMLAVDEFFKTLTVHMNVGVEAHRLAVEEGKSGRELAKRQAELVADPTSLAWNRAYDTALEVSMQEEGGKFRQGVKHAIAAGRRIPYVGYASKFLIPFTNIAINSAAQVGLQSPLGMIPAVAKVVSNIRNGDPMFQGMSNDLARQAVGFAATMAIYSLVGDDNDDEKVTILGKDSKEHKYSIKFGDRYFTYSGIEPIGSFLGLIADASQSAKSGGDAMAMFGDLARSVGNQLAEKPLLGAVTEAAKFATADFGEQVTSEKAAGALMAWAARFGGSFVPAIAKAPERALRGESVERMTWKGNTTEETLGRLGERALSKTDLGLVEEASKFDKWGRRYPETAIEGHPIADFLFRMLSPGKLIKYEPHDGDKLIAKWNNANPKEVYNPSVLDPFYTLNGEKTYFTDKQYARYAEHTGKLASKLFELGKFDAENPTAEQVDAIRDNFTAAKAAIKEHLHEEILAGKQSPIDLDTLAKRLTIKMRKTAAEKLSEGLGARKLGESDATREMKRQKWQEARGQALARLQRLSSDN